MILAIDSATRSGWAYCIGARDWRTGVALGKFEEVREDVLRKAKDAGCTEIICEDVFLGRNFASVKTQMEIRVSWERDAAAMGYRVLPAIMPSTWQSKILVCNGQRPGKGETKKYAAVVARYLGAKCKSQDEADAVCICEYARTVLAKEAAA